MNSFQLHSPSRSIYICLYVCKELLQTSSFVTSTNFYWRLYKPAFPCKLTSANVISLPYFLSIKRSFLVDCKEKYWIDDVHRKTTYLINYGRKSESHDGLFYYSTCCRYRIKANDWLGIILRKEGAQKRKKKNQKIVFEIDLFLFFFF